MKKEFIFPVILMVLDIGAGIVYLASGNIKMFLYWVFACGLTACVTF